MDREPERAMPGAETGNAIAGCFFGVILLAVLVGLIFMARLAGRILPHEEPDFSPATSNHSEP